MRTNPTTSDLGISVLEKKNKTKKLGTYSSNHWSSTGCNFPPPRPSLKNA